MVSNEAKFSKEILNLEPDESRELSGDMHSSKVLNLSCIYLDYMLVEHPLYSFRVFLSHWTILVRIIIL